MKRNCKMMLVAVGVLLLQTLHAQTRLTDKLPVDTSIKIGKLSNGLTYYIRQNKKPENKAELRLVVNAGSILEDNDQQGLAHFTEHMAFNGSTHFKKNELVSYLQSLGIEFGADLNAYTSFDETVYILPVPLSDPSNLGKGLQVLQDWAGGLSFDDDQIDSERGVVLEESRLGKGADDRMFRKIYPLQYAGSRYAERLPIGKDSILKTFKHDAARRFYKQWYRPNLMAVLVVGDVDIAATEKLIHQYFDPLKNPVGSKPRTIAHLYPRQKSASIVVTDKEATNFVTEVDYPFASEKEDVTLGDYRKSLIKQIFAALLNQRLTEKAQTANPPYVYAGTAFSSVARGYEAFTAYTVAGKDGPDTALHDMLTELQRAASYGFTQTELERVKKQQLAFIEKLYNNRDKTESANMIEEYIRNFLTKESIPGISNEYRYYQELLPGITLTEVNALTSVIRNNEHLFVSLQGPSESNFKLPDNKQLLAHTEQWLHEKVSPYEEKKLATDLLKEKPQPGSITSTSTDNLLGTTTYHFANGANVVIKPTNFKSDEIMLSAFHKGGTSSYDVADKYNAANAAVVVQQMGVGDFSPVDLGKLLAGKVAAASPRISGLSAGVSGSSSIKDAETMLQLVYLYLTRPRKDEALFNGWKAKQKAQVQYALADPSNAFVDTLFQVLYQKNPLAGNIIPKPEDFDKIDLDRSIAIYKELLGDATDMTFILVGNIDTTTMKPLLETYIGSLPGTGKTATFKDNGVRMAKGDIDFRFRKGTEAKSLIINCFSGEIPYSPELAMKAQAMTDILNIKITEDLREKMSGIYGGSIYGGINKLPYNNYSLILQLPCGPENVDKLQKAFDEELDSIKQIGPEQKNLDKVKKAWLEKYRVQMKENGFWSGLLQDACFQGDDAHRVFTYEKRVNALTTDDIKQVANQLFDGKNVIKAVLYPEK